MVAAPSDGPASSARTMRRSAVSNDEKSVRIAIVEDDRQLRERFARVVQSTSPLVLEGAHADLTSARASLGDRLPHVMLVDLGLPDGSGIDLIRELAPRGVLCMVITIFGDERHVVEALEAGALGYLLKDEAAERIPRAIRELRDGGSPISASIARHLLRRFRSADTEDPADRAAPARPPADVSNHNAGSRPKLTRRESEVLRLMVKGFTYAEAAKILGVSEHTVATYVRHIYKKLAVHSRGEAVYEALQLGLVQAIE